MDQPLALAPAPPEGLSLDFANTRSWRGTLQPAESLQSPADLLGWFAEAQVLDLATLRRAEAAWAAAPDQAAAGLSRALALREAVFGIFAATAQGAPPPAQPLATLNAALAEAPERGRLCHDGEAWRWAVPGGEPGLPLLLAPVLWSAGDLLAGGRLARVRQCANPRCLWLFLDDSKSANRRWCSMASCGNRAKAHRHYLKQKALPEG